MHASIPTVHDHLYDLTAPDTAVEIEIRQDGTVLWVSVDGVTRLRICRIPRLVITDHREEEPCRSA